MGHRAALAIVSGSIGLAVWAWPVTVNVGLGTDVECGPAITSLLTNLGGAFASPEERLATRACRQRGFAIVLAGVLLGGGGSLAAGVLDLPRSREWPQH